MKGSNLPVYRLVRDVHWLFGVLHVFCEWSALPESSINQSGYVLWNLHLQKHHNNNNKQLVWLLRESFFCMCKDYPICSVHNTHIKSDTLAGGNHYIISRPYKSTFKTVQLTIKNSVGRSLSGHCLRVLQTSNAIQWHSVSLVLLPAQPRDHFIDVV